MKQLQARGVTLVGSALLFAALAACNTSAPGNVQSSGQPLIGAASPTPSANAEATSTALPEGVSFEDDFTGSTLDATRWAAFAQSGVVAVHDGLLDLLTPGNVPNFPYVVTKDAIIPPSGPFFFETKYNRLTYGLVPTLSLDYLPAEAPNETPLTQPFMVVGVDGANLTLVFNTETSTKAYDIPNSAALNVTHRVRVENDGQGNYRVIADDTEIAQFHSDRRPSKFWIGSNPPKDRAPAIWSRMELDYVKAGVLTAPDPATPPPPASATAK